jgi:hypothetical protein
MAGYQPGADWRVGPFDVDDSDSVCDWMAQRNAQLALKQDAEAAGRQAWDQATRSGDDLQAPRPSDLTAIGVQALGPRDPLASDGGPVGASDVELAPVQMPPIDGPFLTPPTFGFQRQPTNTSFSSLPLARSPVVGSAGPGPPAGLAPTGLGAANAGTRSLARFARPAAVGSGSPQITYGALRAPAPSDQELAELRRQQAAFSNTARQIDIRNSWFAAPALAPPLVALGLGALGEWAVGEAAPEAEQAVANFVERDPYLRVGDNWATRAGRRAHAALKERLAQKPGWKYEPRIEEPGDPPLKPDVGAPQRNPLDPRSRKLMELKPDTPSGRAAAARAVKRYLDGTGRTVRPIFYNLQDFI